MRNQKQKQKQKPWINELFIWIAFLWLHKNPSTVLCIRNEYWIDISEVNNSAHTQKNYTLITPVLRGMCVFVVYKCFIYLYTYINLVTNLRIKSLKSKLIVCELHVYMFACVCARVCMCVWAFIFVDVNGNGTGFLLFFKIKSLIWFEWNPN